MSAHDLAGGKPRRRGRRRLLRVGLGAAAVVLVASPAQPAVAAVTPTPTPTAAAAPADDDVPTAPPLSVDDAERQAKLVKGEDDRLIDVRIAGKSRVITYPLRPYRVRSTGFYTLVLPARRAAYTLEDLKVLAPQTFLKQADGSYLLREHILVDAGATLALSAQQPTTIRLLSSAAGFVSIVARGGRIRLLGSPSAPLTFSSWDDTANAPDTTVKDGRSYILAMGQLAVRNARFQHLGFWSGRTGGLAVDGTVSSEAGQGLVVDATPVGGGSSTSQRQTAVLPAGELPAAEVTAAATAAVQVSETEIDGNAFGFFVTGTAGLSINGVVIRNSLVHGLLLHRSVTAATIDQVHVERSAANGVVLTRGVSGVTLNQITSSSNGANGVVITGTPLAKGPSPSGGSVRQFGNNVLTASLLENNADLGVRVEGGTNIRVMGNSLRGGHQGILVANGAAGVVVEANRVLSPRSNGIQVRNATGVEITGNSVRQAPTGIRVQDAVVQASDNTIGAATLHAVSLIGVVTGTTVAGNTLGGSGSSAVDVSRITDGVVPDVRRNETGGWQRVITRDGLVSTLTHPLTLIWIAIGLAVVAARLLTLRSSRRPRVPYLETPARSEPTANVTADQARAIEALLSWEDRQAAPAAIAQQPFPPGRGRRRVLPATERTGPDGVPRRGADERRPWVSDPTVALPTLERDNDRVGAARPPVDVTREWLRALGA